MKKILLSAAVILGAVSIASAETVTLNPNDAKDVVETIDGSNYVFLKSLNIGEFAFTFGGGSSDQLTNNPKLWEQKGQKQIRLYGSAGSTMTISAPEGVKITGVKMTDATSTSTTVACDWRTDNGTITYANKTATWTPATPAQTLSMSVNNNGANKGNPYISSFEVTYEKEGQGAVSNYTYTSTPAEGAVVDSFYKMVLEFNVPVNGHPFGNTAEVTLTNTTTGKVTKFPFILYCDGNKVQFDVDGAAITEPGEYVFTCPAGYLMLDDLQDPDWELTEGNSPEVKVNFTIKGTPKPVALDDVLNYIMPDNEEVDAKSYWEESIAVGISLQGDWVKNTACTAKAAMRKGNAVVGNELEVNNAEYVIVMSADIPGSTEIMLVFSPEAGATDGLYEMTIPEGFFTLNGAPNAEFVHQFQVGKPVVLEDFGKALESILPSDLEGSDAKSLWEERESVDVMAVVNGVLAVNNECKAPITMTLDNAPFGTNIPVNAGEEVMQLVPGNIFGAETGNTRAAAEQYTLILNFATQTASIKGGTYTMTIPEGFFTLNGNPVASYTRSWVVAKEIKGDYGTTPEDGARLTSGTGDFDITFPKAQNVALAEGKAASLMTIEGPQKYNAAGMMPTGNTASFFIMATLGEGDWTVTVPAGTIAVDGTPYDKEIKWSFSIVAPEAVAPQVFPEAGTIAADGLKTITLTFPEGTDVVLGEEDTYMVLLNGMTANTGFSSTYYKAELKGNTIVYTSPLDEPLAEGGKYTFSVGANAYKTNGIFNAAFTIDYTVASASKDYTFVFSPAEGEEVKNVEDVFVTVEGAQSVAIADATKLQFTSGDKKVESAAGIVTEGNKLDFMIFLEPLTDGDWTATLPANVLTIDGNVYDKEISWSFTVKSGAAVELPKPVSTPAEGKVKSEDLNRIVLNLADDAKATAIGEEGTYMITLAPEGGWSVRTYSIAIGDDANEIILTAEGANLPELEEGNYVLTVSPNAYFVGNQGNGNYTYNFEVTTSSVDGIFADDTEFNVYTTTGICVINNGTAADVELLPAGLYIINGKKVVIRK